MSLLLRYMCRVFQKLPFRLHNSSGTYKKCSKILHKTSAVPFRYLHDDNETENVEEHESVAELYEETPAFVRNALYPESKDSVINSLLQCTSIQEALDIIKTNKAHLNKQQITQTVACFWDLIKVLHYLSGAPESIENVKSNGVVLQLYKNSEFQTLLDLIENNLTSFNASDLSYIYLYLTKLGLNEYHHTIKKIVQVLKSKLLEDFSLSSASRYVTSCFSKNGLQSYFNVQVFIPLIFREIDNCQTPEEIRFLSLCIGTSYAFVTNEILQKYKQKINEMIDDFRLRAEDYRVVLKVLSCLNNPLHRDENIDLIRKCCVLIKRKISEMNATEVCLLYEVFYTNQESAEIVNEIQRNTTKHFLQMEEESNPNLYLRLRLLSVLTSIASSHQKHQYHRTAVEYSKKNVHPNALFILRKIFTDIKTADKAMCNRLWDQIRRFVVKHDDRNLLKLVSEYSNFNADIVNFRHIKFENVLTLLIDKELNQGIFYHLPSVLAHISLLYIPYSNSRRKVEKIINKLCENCTQLNSIDWLKISKAIQLARETTNNPTLQRDDCIKIKRACDAYVFKNIGNLNLSTITVLLKCYILREEYNNRLVDYLLIAVSASPQMSSNLMKNTVYCFRNTHSYSPDVLDRMGDYIYANYNHLLANTIEKYLYFCYYACHLPRNSETIFKVITDILIRDIERMNGLTYLQASLALCYFYKLPRSFIKHIFNVEFLEKLDSELDACYAKETYPFRVRHLMMQLNRAVCLDYPETNVPWFHEKYIQERKQAANRKMTNNQHVFYLQVYESLLAITGSPSFIMKDVDAPYGYFIDFVITLNKRNEISDPVNGAALTQLAFCLPKSNFYLRFDNQLIGQYDLKKRHLEILGYKVFFIDFRDWWLLASNKDRVDYLKSFIWPDKTTKHAVR